MFDRLDPALREIASENDGFDGNHSLASPRSGFHSGSPRTPCSGKVEDLTPEPGRLRFWGADPPYRASKNTPLVRAFLQAIRAERLDPAFKVKSGTSDMNVVGPVWHCPILAYGPGDSSLDHTPDEASGPSGVPAGDRRACPRSPVALSPPLGDADQLVQDLKGRCGTEGFPVGSRASALRTRYRGPSPRLRSDSGRTLVL